MSTTESKRFDFIVDGKGYAITDGEVKDVDLDFIGEYINVTTSILRKGDIGYNGELMNDKLPKLFNEFGIYLYNNPKPYPSVYDPRSKTGMFDIGPELAAAEKEYYKFQEYTYRNPIIYKRKDSILPCDEILYELSNNELRDLKMWLAYPEEFDIKGRLNYNAVKLMIEKGYIKDNPDCREGRKTVWVTTGQCMGGEVEGYWKEV